jgi:hypothetical protein
MKPIKNAYVLLFKLISFLGYIKNNVEGFNMKTQLCVITFYTGQVACIKEKIRLEFSEKDAEDIRVMTVDSFQGSECDCIILSFVRSNNHNNIGFIQDPRRLNVALTRAKFLLLAVGDTNTLCYGRQGSNRTSEKWGMECPVGELIQFASEAEIILDASEFVRDHPGMIFESK